MNREVRQDASIAASTLWRPRRVTSKPEIGGKGFLARVWHKLITIALPAALIALFINVFVAQAMLVHGPSMQPNLFYNHRVVVDKITYRFTSSPRRGDVVVIDRPSEKNLLVKRVVALPGETVSIQSGQVFINGQLLAETWTTHHDNLDYPSTFVPARHVFVLGDNRVRSRDSRFFGPVPVEQITGHVRFIVWPLDSIGQIH